MPLARCRVATNETTPVFHTYFPLSAIVKMEGDKKPDTLEVTFPTSNDVAENYQITYIQDIIDTTYLKAVYPMQLSCLDESGFDVDPTEPASTRFVKVSSGKYKGHYALEFDADGEGVEVTDPRNEINISKQFDIHVKFTPDTTQLQDLSDEPILWSFLDKSDPRGIEFGITGTNGDDPSWKVFIRYSNGSITQFWTGGTTGLIMTGAPVHIRVKRGQDNVVRAYVNGFEDITETSSVDFQPVNATNMSFGDTPDSSSDEYSGLIHEIRFYSGTDLDDEEAERIRWSKPIPQIMKFAGRVSKITSNQVTNKLMCQSNSFRFTKGKLGGATGTSSTALSTDFDTLLQDAVDVISPQDQFTVRHTDSFAHVVTTFSLTGNIFEIGNFMQYAGVLLTYAECIMYMTPRKNIIVETNAGHTTDYLFDQDGLTTSGTAIAYHIQNTETNDIKLINEVILTGRSGTTNQTSEFTPAQGIRRSLRRNVNQIDVNNNLAELAIKIRLDLQGEDLIKDVAEIKFLIQSSSPTHHVRYNHTVKVSRKSGYNDSITFDPSRGGDDIFEEVKIVRQLEYHYPSGKTIIKVAENDIDFYDDVVNVSRMEDGLLDTTL